MKELALQVLQFSRYIIAYRPGVGWRVLSHARRKMKELALQSLHFLEFQYFLQMVKPRRDCALVHGANKQQLHLHCICAPVHPGSDVEWRNPSKCQFRQVQT